MKNQIIKRATLFIFFIGIITFIRASYILIPMDLEQNNHLKAYGIAYYPISRDVEMRWLLNYRGGSFMCPYNNFIEDECIVRDVSYQVIADVQANAILTEIAAVENNMDEIRLQKVPKIAKQQ